MHLLGLKRLVVRRERRRSRGLRELRLVVPDTSAVDAIRRDGCPTVR
jgi:hypothetical protein